MLPFDLDKLGKLIPNRFYMVLAIVDRVRALKKGVEPKVERRKRDYITVAIEEFEKNKVEFYVQDNYVSPVAEMMREKETERKRLGSRPSFETDSDAD
ncbi:MAG: DNA-directed RNA polymerase subunit omega [Candidatus Wallbacteria bacterium]|nr:DNA-directed RNA polymerase subunit omega [Candidatus Wallbacteria bacterium]